MSRCFGRVSGRQAKPDSLGSQDPATRLRFQPHLRQPVAQGVARKAQHPRGLALVAVGAAQRLADDLLLVLVERQALGQEVSLA